MYNLLKNIKLYPVRDFFCRNVEIIPEREYYDDMNKIGNYIKEERKKAGLTQEEFAMRSGLGLRFVRELEQGKETVRMDKVNQAIAMFGKEAVPGERKITSGVRI